MPAELDAWNSLLLRAVVARTAAQVRALRTEADALGSLPIDLINAAETEALAKTIATIFRISGKALQKRIEQLSSASDLVFELCCLRDTLHTS